MQVSTYSDIKALVLRRYLDFAMSRGIAKGWSIEQVVGSVAYELENAFESPLHDAMAQVVLLSLCWPDANTFNGAPRSALREMLCNSAVSNAIVNLDALEKDELLEDLGALGISASSHSE
ncbi:hypothetical protein JY96_21760 [Aquabacterium sp. NJ1]|nr:hypothetical protein JY96_21760 [Aquabacterium sp. NJ1]